MQLKFSIIGTGNMAWFLAEKLCAAGHHFEGVFGRNIVAVNDISSHYATTVYTSTEEIPDTENHFCFIAVKDAAIPELAAPLLFTETMLLHTAGAASINLLAQHAKKNGIFWPVYSIVKTHNTLPDNIPVALEGNNKESENELLILARSISGNTFIASETQRFNLHLSAVFANNFTNHLIAIAEDICAKQDIAFDYLKPILAQTFDRLNSHTAKKSQTGPAIRGDEITMEKHLKLLGQENHLIALYQTLSISIRKMYDGDAQ